MGSWFGNGRSDYEGEYRLDRDIDFDELHTHQFYEFYFYINGGSSIYVKNKMIELKKNTVLIYPPHVVHGRLEKEHLHNYERAFLYLTKELIRNFGHDLVDLEKLILSRANEGIFQYTLDPAVHKECVEMVKQIRAHKGSSSPMDEFEDYSLMSRILVYIAKAVAAVPVKGDALPGDSVTRRVMDYINDHYNEDLSLESLAKQNNVSISHLSHQFTRLNNCTVHAYIHYCRISHAKELMLSGMSPTDAAYAVGFNDYSNFLRSYQKWEQCSPREFIRQVRGKAE